MTSPLNPLTIQTLFAITPGAEKGERGAYEPRWVEGGWLTLAFPEQEGAEPA